MRKYTGITIGPIAKTIQEASTPAALWFGSILFSNLTRLICENLTYGGYFSDVKLYSPYYSDTIVSDDGIGKFHDRIIFSAESCEREQIEEMLEQVTKQVHALFPADIADEQTLQFLKEYLQIHYVVLSEEEMGDQNCVLALSPYLDCLELMETFPSDDTYNPLRKIFGGTGGGRNEKIKESPLFRQVNRNTNQLCDCDGSIRQIGEIASGDGKLDRDKKSSHYFAVVYADGDNMGRFLKQLDNEGITPFSRACFRYAEKAADRIRVFGGMTIYAGGDDLLFLAPLKDTEGNDVFDLCHDINGLFRETLEEEGYRELIPTISFGISIQYEKYPLYEARNNAGALLFGTLKQDSSTKNSMLIELQKHSGQSLRVLVSHKDYDVFHKLLHLRAEAAETEMTSVIHTLETFRDLLSVIDTNGEAAQLSSRDYMDAWENLFDNEGQKAMLPYVRELCEIYYHYFIMHEAGEIRIHGLEGGQPLDTLISILQLKKFFAEKGGEQ